MDIIRPQASQPIPPHAKKVFRGAVFDVYQWEQKMFDGSLSLFEKLKRKDTVIIFAVMPDGKILLTEQEQPGRKPFIAATGGSVEEGEEVLTGAKRELLEESGYAAEKFVLWKSLQPFSKIEWAVYVFVAKGLKKVTEPELDAGEKIKLMPVAFSEFLDMPFRTDVVFSEQEVVDDLLKARINEEYKQKLEELFKLE